ASPPVAGKALPPAQGRRADQRILSPLERRQLTRKIGLTVPRIQPARTRQRADHEYQDKQRREEQSSALHAPSPCLKISRRILRRLRELREDRRSGSVTRIQPEEFGLLACASGSGESQFQCHKFEIPWPSQAA